MVRRSRYVKVQNADWGVLVDQFGNQRMPRRNELLRTSNPPFNVVRSRPREHERSGFIRGGSYVSPSRVNAGVNSISQTGAKELRYKNKTYYELGGGIFTRGQILESRWRYGQLKVDPRISKKVVGL